jgi:hypothetical protein
MIARDQPPVHRPVGPHAGQGLSPDRIAWGFRVKDIACHQDMPCPVAKRSLGQTIKALMACLGQTTAHIVRKVSETAPQMKIGGVNEPKVRHRHCTRCPVAAVSAAQ